MSVIQLIGNNSIDILLKRYSKFSFGYHSFDYHLKNKHIYELKIENIKLIINKNTFPAIIPDIYINDKLFKKINNTPITFYLNKGNKNVLHYTSITQTWTNNNTIIDIFNEIDYLHNIKNNSIYWLAINIIGKKFRLAEDIDYIIMDYCR